MSDGLKETVDLSVPFAPHTAVPLLGLMLAAEGVTHLDFGTGWDFFKRILELPVATIDEGATFQVNWADEGEGYYVFFGRQMSYDDDPESEYSYAVGISYYFEPGERARPDEVELWSADYASLETFLTEVEGYQAFRTGLAEDWVGGFVQDIES